jgi:hypothetical protein
MEMQIRIFSTVFFLLISNPSYAKTTKAIIPHYQVILDAQFKCSKKDFNKIPIDPSREFALAPKAWSVITNLKLVEVPKRQNAPDDGESRSFDLSFTGMGYFECGEPVEGLDNPKGKQVIHYKVIELAYKKNQFLNLTNDDTSFAEGWQNFTSNVRSTDIPIKPDTMGFTCLVLLDDLLKNPNSIDLKKLCAGESKKKIEFTKKEIKKAIEFWKKK